MKRLFIVAMSFLFLEVNAQDTTTTIALYDSSTKPTKAFISSSTINTNKYYEGSSPYKTTFKKDFPITLGFVGLTALGNQMIRNKKGLTEAEVLAKDPSKVPGFDRGNLGYYDEKIDEASYPVLYGSFALPIAVGLLDGKERNRFGQVIVLYTESMAVTGALFSIAAGSFSRARPLVYSSTAPMSVRMSKNNQRSFFAGHTASVASASFFMAKVFSDFNPDSKLKPVVWIVAAGLPAYIGWSRYKSGHHFLSDNLLGYAVGAASGILIPHWHKTSKIKKNMSIVPVIGSDYRGMSIAYKF